MKRKIYNVKNGVIEVYDFETLQYRMNLFRLEELKRIPQREQILRREPTRSWFTPRKGVVYECDNYILREFDLSKLDEVDQSTMIRRSYINGIFRSDPVEERSDLITLSPRKGLTDFRVQLTEDAYMGYLLDNEQFDHPMLRDHRLDKQKELFQISDAPVDTISIPELEKMYQHGIVEGDYYKTMDSLERTSKVYQKIR